MKKILPKKCTMRLAHGNKPNFGVVTVTTLSTFFSACVKVPSNTRRASHCKLRNSALEF